MSRYLNFKRHIGKKLAIGFTCSRCTHGVLAHKTAKPLFQKYDAQQLGAMLKPDLDLHKRTLPFCDLMLCDICCAQDALKGCDNHDEIIRKAANALEGKVFHK